MCNCRSVVLTLMSTLFSSEVFVRGLYYSIDMILAAPHCALGYMSHVLGRLPAFPLPRARLLAGGLA